MNFNVKSQNSSARKRAANRNNSQNSTGPKTERGKSFSRRNAVKHGLFSNLAFRELDQVPGYADAQQLLASLREAYPPQSPFDAIRIERIATDLWRYGRATRIEVLETERKYAFDGGSKQVDRVIRFSSMTEKAATKAFNTLEMLEAEAQAAAESEETDDEGTFEAPLPDSASNGEATLPEASITPPSEDESSEAVDHPPTEDTAAISPVDPEPELAQWSKDAIAALTDDEPSAQSEEDMDTDEDLTLAADESDEDYGVVDGISDRVRHEHALKGGDEVAA